MNFLVPVTMIACIPAVLVTFMLLPPRRAVIVSCLVSWLFLPVAHYSLPGFPDYNKISAPAVAVLLGVILFDADRLLAFRPRLLDLPMLVWCLCPIGSSLTNGLGLYDGLTAAFNQVICYGIFYLMGRLYFSDLVGLRELAVGVFVGGLIYVPLCLYEIRMSPQLHRMVYGYHAHSFLQTLRFGGWRPTVFMSHGLAVGVWMATASIAGLWLWWSRALRYLWQIPTAPLVFILFVTTFMCKSLNADVLLIIGLGALAFIRMFRSALPISALVLGVVVYVLIRGPGLWTGDMLVDFAAQISENRAASLEFRLRNEDMLAAKAMQRPLFGWGGWNRSRVFDERGNDISITDSFWIIQFGSKGILGIGSFLVAALLPVGVLQRRLSARTWAHPLVAPVLALALLLILVMVDNLFNHMYNPIYIIVIGALTILRLPRLSRAALLARRHAAATASGQTKSFIY